MAVTTKKLFSATTNATTTVFSPVSIQLNNQDDLDVYVTLSGGTRVLQLRQSTGSTAQSSHPQVNNTDGLYFPAVSAGTTLYNYQLSTDNNTITFNSALPQGAVVFCERRTRDADSSYTSFASGSTIRATDLNNSSTESNFTAQDGRNKALEIEGVLFRGDQPSTNFVTTDHIVAGTIVTNDIANDSVNADKIPDDTINSEHYVDLSIDTQHIANENVTTAKLAPDAVTSAKLADNAVDSEHYVDGSVDHVHLANDAVDGDNIADDSINSEHYVDGSIDTQHIAADQITNALIADNQIDSEHYVDGSVDHVHLANDCIDGDNIQDDVVNSEHIAAGALDNEHYAAGSITSDKLNAATVVTASEQASAASNDTSFLTTAASDARFFNVSTGDTIKDGDSFPDNDTTIATTAAINDRIIDLVDDVGGFVPIANETSFPNANPDVNNGTGTIVSVSTLASNHTSSGSGVITISNGTVGNSTVTINGAANSTTYSAGYGLLVETTTTLNTYTFHRLVPKATEVTTVAGKATEIGRLGTAAAVEDMSILGTADVVADLNTLGTADVVSDLNTLGTADVVADMNTLAVTSVINNMDTVATNVTNVNLTGGSITNVNTTAGSIANVNTVAGSIANVNTTAGSISNVNTVGNAIANVNTTATNIADVNNFADLYQIHGNNPTTDGGGNALAAGDLYFNTNSNSLKVYTGSAWVDGVTATGSFAVTTGNTFTGDNVYNDNVKLNLGTSSDLEIFHDGSNSVINEKGTGSLQLQQGGSTKLFLQSTAVHVNGNIVVSGNVDGRDLAADGTKLDGIESGATADQTASDIKTLLNSSGLVNAQIDASAAIAGSKISPTFTSNVEISNTYPSLTFTDTNNNSDYRITNNDGQLIIYDVTNSAHRLNVNSDGNVQIPADNKYLQIGASADLNFHHDGSHSYISNTTGTLHIMGKSGENSIQCQPDGKVELYYDNSAKFETTSTGAKFTSSRVQFHNSTSSGSYIQCSNTGTGHNSASGFWLGANSSNQGVVQNKENTDILFYTNDTETFRLKANGDVNISGDKGLFIGANNDLMVAHDGTSTRIEDSYGYMNIKSDILELRSKTDSEYYAKFTRNGAVELYYDNDRKFRTLSNGCQVESASGDTFLIVRAEGDDASTDAILRLSVQNASATSIIQFGDQDSSSIGQILYEHADNSMRFRTNGSEHWRITSAGHLENNSDTGILKLGASDDLQIYHDGSHNRITGSTGDLNISNTGDDIQITAADDLILNVQGSENAVKCIGNGQVELYYDNTKKLETTSAGVTVTGTVAATSFTGDGSNLTGVSSAEIYGFNTDANGGLIVTTTNGGADNISGSTFDAFEDVVFAATGITFSLDSSGDLIATI